MPVYANGFEGVGFIMNYRMIFHFLGRIMGIEAILMLPALGISLFQGESDAVRGFLISIAALLILGLLSAFFRPGKSSFYNREGFVIVGISWIAVSLFGALPFFLSGAIPNFIDCLFETVSGFTTTGASILADVESLPMGILYWRSFTHWLGGMGVLVFLLALVPMNQRGSGNSLHVLRAESPGPQVGKLVPRLRQTAKILYAIYFVMTVIQILLLLIGGLPLFDSVTLSFGTAGTGGFSIRNDSIAGYSSYAQTVITIFMTLFGINFNIYYLLLIRAFSKAFFNEELRAYLGIMIGSTLLITWNIFDLFERNFGQALHHAAFQVSSIMTTTGYATMDFNTWPEFSRVILVILMILGASAGSTGGGIKISRLLILLKAARNTVSRLLHPRTVKVAQMDGETLDHEVMRSVNGFMTLYCTIAILSVFLISIDNFPFETNLTAILACLNNIGPGLGLVGPTGNYSAFSGFSKLVLSANMLLGRLEIFPMLILFAPSVWKNSIPHTAAG